MPIINLDRAASNSNFSYDNYDDYDYDYNYDDYESTPNTTAVNATNVGVPLPDQVVLERRKRFTAEG